MKALIKFSKISENVSINLLKQNYGLLKKENKININTFFFSDKYKYQQEGRILKNSNNIKNKKKIFLIKNFQNFSKFTKKYFINTISLNLEFLRDDSEVSDTDILILGGGLSGLSLACALVYNDSKQTNINKKLNISLLDFPHDLKDENFFVSDKRLPDPKVISLSPASIRFFKSIGLWERLDQKLIKYIKGFQIWEDNGPSCLHLDASDVIGLKHNIIINLVKKTNLLNLNFLNLDVVEKIPDEYVCVVVEIKHIIFHMLQMIKDKVNILHTKIQEDKLEIENTEDFIYFKLKNENKTTIRSKLLISSDERNLIIRKKLNISTVSISEAQTGLICNLKGNTSSDFAYQRFLNNGIFALLPLYDDLFSMICLMPKNIIDNIKNISNEELVEYINKMLLYPPCEIENSKFTKFKNSKHFLKPPIITDIISKRLDISPQLQYASIPVEGNCILIGDAPYVVHPMVGQGLNLGISDASFLADEIIKAINMGRKINDSQALNDFVFKSQINTKLMLMTIESIRSLNNPSNSLLSYLRNIGISLSNNSEIMRGLFILSASGLISQPSKFSWEN